MVAKLAPKELTLIKMESVMLLILNAGHGTKLKDFAYLVIEATTLSMVHASFQVQIQLLFQILDATFGKRESALNAQLDGCSMKSESVSLLTTSVERLMRWLNASPAIEDMILSMVLVSTLLLITLLYLIPDVIFGMELYVLNVLKIGFSIQMESVLQ